MQKVINRPPRGSDEQAQQALSESELLALEASYCSHGDTVHYTNPPKIFERAEGAFLYDVDGKEYLDLQMWYSAVNFGYRNSASTRPFAVSSTDCHRSPANTCIAKRSSSPPSSPATRKKNSAARVASISTSAVVRRSKTA